MQDMAPGGVWIRRDGFPDTYVAMEPHVKRLLEEGGSIIPDPRQPTERVVPASLADELQAQVDALKAQLAQAHNEQAQSTEEVADASTTNDVRSDNKGKRHDRRPYKRNVHDATSTGLS